MGKEIYEQAEMELGLGEQGDAPVSERAEPESNGESLEHLFLIRHGSYNGYPEEGGIINDRGRKEMVGLARVVSEIVGGSKIYCLCSEASRATGSAEVLRNGFGRGFENYLESKDIRADGASYGANAFPTINETIEREGESHGAIMVISHGPIVDAFPSTFYRAKFADSKGSSRPLRDLDKGNAAYINLKTGLFQIISGDGIVETVNEGNKIVDVNTNERESDHHQSGVVEFDRDDFRHGMSFSDQNEADNFYETSITHEDGRVIRELIHNPYGYGGDDDFLEVDDEDGESEETYRAAWEIAKEEILQDGSDGGVFENERVWFDADGSLVVRDQLLP